ncbi:MAG: Rieske (2Fe-2S) protein [Calditrichia bacterium]
MKKSRRSFINYLLSTSLGAFLTSVLYPIFQYLKPPKIPEAQPANVLAGTLYELKPESAKIIRFGRKPVIVIRTGQGKVLAFSAVCTHLSCIVQYRKDLKHIWCACHNGHYDLTGRNIAGPPPRPLPVFRVDIQAEKIYVSKES